MSTADSNIVADLVPQLPSVVALPLTDYLNETHPVLKLWHACDTVEMLLRLLTSAGLADVARAGLLPDTLVSELRSRIEEPTLGSWRAMAEVVAVHLAKLADCVLPELAPYVRETLVPFLNGVGESERTTETSFIALRNRLAHGGAMTKNRGQELCNHWAQSFEEMIRRAAWLAEVDIVVRLRAGEFGALRGPTAEPLPWTPVDPAAIDAVLPREGDVALCRGGRVLLLAPLQSFGLPVLPEFGSTRFSQATPLAYLRRGDVCLQFTPVGSDEACQSEGDATAWEVFRRMFRLDEAELVARSLDFAVRGFEADLQKDARRVVGRAREIEALLVAVREKTGGVLWLSGPAGIGKSYVVARVANELLEEPPAGTLVLAYRFRAGDDRCSRQNFLQFANERLEKFIGCPAKKEGDCQPKPLERFRELLSAASGPVAGGQGEVEVATESAPSAAAARRVLLILDGLDEIAERDGRFASEVVLSSSASGVTWLCAGRDERGLDQVFTKSRRALPGGLGPMTKDGIRAMLLTRIGNLRRRLLGSDRERGDEVVNPFIDRVAKAADGLPLYVTYLIGDILGNRFRALDAGEQLPPTLVHYQEDLLNRLGIDDVQQLKTTLAATLAVAYEPLSAAALADLLHRRTLLAAQSDVELVHRTLGAVGSIIRRSVTPEGEVGYTLYHQSLREHMFGSDRVKNSITTARAAFANAAQIPGNSAASAYLFRRGIEHLLKAQRSADALGLLCSFRYLMARLQLLGDPAGVRGIDEDWREYGAASDILAGRDDRLSEAFWRERAHILRRGNAEWPAYKILLQLAIEHADDSPLTIGAEQWLAGERCDWIWLRCVPRLPHVEANACLAVLEGHADSIRGAVPVADRRLLSWSLDKTLRLWDLQRGICIAVLKGHTKWINGALALPDGRLLSWCDDTLRLWDLQSGGGEIILEGHTCAIAGAHSLPNGRIVTWSTQESTLRIWDTESAKWVGELEGHANPIRGALVLPDGRLLSWCKDTLRLWVLQSGGCQDVLEGHTRVVEGAIALPNGRIATWSNQESTLQVWNSESGRWLEGLKGHVNPIRGAYVLPDERLLSWSEDTWRVWDLEHGTCVTAIGGREQAIDGALALPNGRIVTWCKQESILRLWDTESGKRLAELEGHSDPVRGALVLPDGRLLSWSEDTLRIWDAQIETCPVRTEGHSMRVCGALTLATGGVLTWSEDRTLRLWDTQFGRCSSVLRGHQGQIRGALELADGNLLSWSDDLTLRLWDACHGKCHVVLKGNTRSIDGAFELADGKVLSWDDENTFGLWDTHSGECLDVVTENDVGTLYPHWLQARAETRVPETVWNDFFAVFSERFTHRFAHLRHTAVSAILANWNADNELEVRCLHAGGTLVVTPANGHVRFLKLYHGNRRITLPECEELKVKRGGACFENRELIFQKAQHACPRQSQSPQ